MAEENTESESSSSTEDTAPAEKFDVVYACLRCGTAVSNSELSRLPEIKCICGFRVFSKTRPQIVKSIKAI